MGVQCECNVHAVLAPPRLGGDGSVGVRGVAGAGQQGHWAIGAECAVGAIHGR